MIRQEVLGFLYHHGQAIAFQAFVYWHSSSNIATLSRTECVKSSAKAGIRVGSQDGHDKV